MAHVSIIGSGSWGLTIGTLCAYNGHRVTVWCPRSDTEDYLTRHRRHPDRLPGWTLPDAITPTTDMSVAAQADAIIIALPSKHFYFCDKFIAFPAIETPVAVLTKGFVGNHDATLPLSYLEAQRSGLHVACLSGPNLADEIIARKPAAAVVASAHPETALFFQTLLGTAYFRIYTAADTTGVQLGGVLKNVMAVAAGLSDGLDLGYNAKAALITRGLSEMIRFGVALGAQADTFFGLSGLGDLIATCHAPTSRNYQVGKQVAASHMTPDELDAMVVAEGVKTARIAHDWARFHNVDMPITTAVYQVLYCRRSPAQALADLMTRSLRAE